ncbi:F-box/LRR-repeat protein 4-like isoform X2 [Tachypleus tridentatus]|uniref:F-box/LRR-repeat protein 4-like isoform X2 n=1 Tax=Tachypleus tridentatus TaxID=6853 RepID=UPI003FD4652E
MTSLGFYVAKSKCQNVESKELILKQYVSDVVDFSSQYGSDFSISYTAANIIGKPNIYPNYGDFTKAFITRTYGPWWSICPSASQCFLSPLPKGRYVQSQDFIEIQFEEKVSPLRIDIYETYNPGSVVRISAFDASEVNHLFVEFYHKHLSYYSEIDAILLVGTKTDVFSGFTCGREPKVDDVLTSFDLWTLQSSVQASESLLRGNGYFDLLPTEVLHLIFSYLDLISLCKAARVSRLFKKHFYDPVLFSELDLQPYWDKVTIVTLQGLENRCLSLQRLNLSWCGGEGRLTPSSFVQFVNKCGQKLTFLKVSNCSFFE